MSNRFAQWTIYNIILGNFFNLARSAIPRSLNSTRHVHTYICDVSYVGYVRNLKYESQWSVLSFPEKKEKSFAFSSLLVHCPQKKKKVQH